MIAIPKKAATVILLREMKPEGFEAFLLQRHEKSSFMGGNFVYPGGRVDRSDGSSEICSNCKGISPEEAQQMLGGLISPDESIGHWVAGVRELFEEAGVLLARDQKGNSLTFGNTMDQNRFLEYRSLLQKGELTICQIVQKEDLFLALDKLHYYAHWITPEARSERFDTRFFIACQPEGQDTTYDQKETTVGMWLTPQAALEENLKGEVALSPPTLKTLEDLSRYKTIGELFKSLEKKEREPVLPILTKIAGDPIIIFPWDPEFETFRNREIPRRIDHGRPSRPEDNTTRVILKKGFWIPYCCHK